MPDPRLLPQLEDEVVGEQADLSNLEDVAAAFPPRQQDPGAQDFFKDCNRARLHEEAQRMVFHGAQEVASPPSEKYISTDRVRTWYFRSWRVQCKSRPINAHPEDIHYIKGQSTDRSSVKRGLYDTGYCSL